MIKKPRYITSEYLDYKEAFNKANELINEGNRIGLLIMFGINTGLRYSDLSRLHDKDIEAARRNNNRLLLIEKKRGKMRIIKLNNFVLSAYEKFPQIGYLFRSQKGSIYDISYINKKLKTYFKNEYKRNVSTHSLRKTFARTFYNNAQDKTDALVTLNETLQHNDIAVTRKYLGITAEEVEAVYDGFENILNN